MDEQNTNNLSSSDDQGMSAVQKQLAEYRKRMSVKKPSPNQSQSNTTDTKFDYSQQEADPTERLLQMDKSTTVPSQREEKKQKTAMSMDDADLLIDVRASNTDYAPPSADRDNVINRSTIDLESKLI